MRIVQQTGSQTYWMQTGDCDLNIQVKQTGVLASGVGTFQCMDRAAGSVVISKMMASENVLRMNLLLTDSGPVRCIQETVFGGVK